MIVLLPVLLAAGFLLTYEWWAMFTGRPLVTVIVRRAFEAYPPLGFLVGLGAGLLLSHLFWYR